MNIHFEKILPAKTDIKIPSAYYTLKEKFSFYEQINTNNQSYIASV